MTLDTAIHMLRAFGLIVRLGPGPTLNAMADPVGGGEVPSESGAGYQFSLSIQRVATGWALRLGPGDGRKEFSNLEKAVLRAEREFFDYRELHSPAAYGDQFACFESDEPLTAIETALVHAGWLAHNEALEELGLKFVGGARFRITFKHKRRMVLVVVNPAKAHGWRLTVKCYRQATVPASSGRVPLRGHQADGTPILDELAPELSYRVAAVLHGALAQVASAIKWSVHHDPTCGAYFSEPLPPKPG